MGRPKKIKKIDEIKLVEGLKDAFIKTDAVGTDGCKATTSTNEYIKPNKEKLERAKNLMKDINKEFGENSVCFASEQKKDERVPFGVPDLDLMLGGGLPSRKFSVIWGGEGAGKTSLCYYLIAQAQKQGKICAMLPIERTFDNDRAKYFGVDLNHLILAPEFNTAEEYFNFFRSLVKNSACDLIILDSLHGLSPVGEQETKKGVEKGHEDETMALLARRLSEFFRKTSAYVYKSNVAVLLIGQTRTNLGGFIAFQTLSGGAALHHWASLILHISRGAKADAPVRKYKEDGKTKEEIVGFPCNIKLDKTKITSKVEGTKIQLPFYFASGFGEEKNDI